MADLARGILAEEKAREAARLVRGLERLGDVGELMELLA